MASLMDTIRQNSTQMATQDQGVTDETQKAAGLLAAKSGKQVGGGDITQSNLGEQSAVAQTNNTMRNQVLPAQQIQQQGQEAQSTQQTQQTQLAQQQISQGRQFDTLQSKIKSDQILQDLEQQKGEIDLNRDRSKIDQLGQNLRLSNQQYIDNLNREGTKSRLDSQIGFQEQLAKSILGDSQDLMEQKLGNQSIIRATDRDFNKEVANIDIGFAQQMFANEMSANKTRQTYSGIGSLATAGIGAYGSYANSSSGSGSSSTAKPSSSGNLNAGESSSDTGSIA